MYVGIDTIFQVVFAIFLIAIVGIASIKLYYVNKVKGKVKVQLRREWGEDEVYICKADGMVVEPPIGKKSFIMKPICASDSRYPEGVPAWLQSKVKQAWWYEGDVNAILPVRDKAKVYSNDGEVLEFKPGDPVYSPVTPSELRNIKQERWTEVSVAESQREAEFKDNIRAAIKNMQTKWLVYMLLFAAVAVAGVAAYFGYMNLQYLIAMYGA
jgi:hypothetical protein